MKPSSRVQYPLQIVSVVNSSAVQVIYTSEQRGSRAILSDPTKPSYDLVVNLPANGHCQASGSPPPGMGPRSHGVPKRYRTGV